MSWCVLTPATEISIDIAMHVRRHHTPRTRWSGKRCSRCRDRWGRYGCRPYLWATDYLSGLSKMLVPDRPERPKPGRHRPAYTQSLTAEAEVVRERVTRVRAEEMSRHNGRDSARTGDGTGSERTCMSVTSAQPGAGIPHRYTEPAAQRARAAVTMPHGRAVVPAPRPKPSGPRPTHAVTPNREPSPRAISTDSSASAATKPRAEPSRPSLAERARILDREAEKAARSRAGTLQDEELDPFDRVAWADRADNRDPADQHAKPTQAKPTRTMSPASARTVPPRGRGTAPARMRTAARKPAHHPRRRAIVVRSNNIPSTVTASGATTRTDSNTTHRPATHNRTTPPHSPAAHGIPEPASDATTQHNGHTWTRSPTPAPHPDTTRRQPSTSADATQKPRTSSSNRIGMGPPMDSNFNPLIGSSGNTRASHSDHAPTTSGLAHSSMNPPQPTNGAVAWYLKP